MMTTVEFLLLFMLLFFILILNEFKEAYTLKKYSTINFEMIQKILDEIIDEEFLKYRLLNIEYQEEPYISEEEQKKMIIEITSAVYQRVKNSKLIRTNLGMIYNVKNKNDFIKIISSKVSIYSISYVKETNKQIQ